MKGFESESFRSCRPCCVVLSMTASLLLSFSLIQVHTNQLLHQIRSGPFCGQHRFPAHGAHPQAAPAARRQDLWD